MYRIPKGLGFFRRKWKHTWGSVYGRLAALKFCFKTCVAMKFVDDDDDDDRARCHVGRGRYSQKVKVDTKKL